MKAKLPTAQEYSSQKAHYTAMTVVDIRSEQAGITDSYHNRVLFNINKECMRLSVFEGEYRWHYHPDSDELFLVVTGKLQIDFEGGAQVILTEWQSMAVPARSVHRTRAIGRTVNVTYEKQGAKTVFVGFPPSEPLKNPYTQKQGQYLAFIYCYAKIHGCPPAEADMQKYFHVTPPSVHQMVLTLEKQGFITRVPKRSRSIQLLLRKEELPDLD